MIDEIQGSDFGTNVREKIITWMGEIEKSMHNFESYINLLRWNNVWYAKNRVYKK